jgi:hypothetical protein
MPVIPSPENQRFVGGASPWASRVTGTFADGLCGSFSCDRRSNDVKSDSVALVLAARVVMPDCCTRYQCETLFTRFVARDAPVVSEERGF